MQTRTRVVAVVTAGALALAGCTSGDTEGDDTQPETTSAGTVTETTLTDTTAADTSTTGASTDTTSDGAAVDTTVDGGVAGIDLDALDTRFDQLADQVEATGNDALNDAWDELETRYEDVRGAVESGDFAGVSSEEVSTALEGFQETIDQNLGGLDPELVQGWNDLVAELEAVIPAIPG